MPVGTVNTGRNKVLLGVTGSIAAYKAIELVRFLKDRGLEVRVVMTESATEFVKPLTFEAVSGEKVTISFWEQSDQEGMQHIELGSWADIIAVVPATADTISKITHGNADNELLASILVSRAPLLIAPAMNSNMYEHAATQDNLKKLIERGVEIIEPEEGELACGWQGTGRLAENHEILYRILRSLCTQDLKDKKVVVSAGPTREMIDPVRFISNCSSGRMGIAIAKEAYLRGARVSLVHGAVEVKVPDFIKCQEVQSADDMYTAMQDEVYSEEDPADIVVMTAAVADVKPKNVEEDKIKQTEDWKSLELTPNKDILAELGNKRQDKTPVLVGFAVETGEPEDLIESVKDKIVQKNADIIIGNLAHEAFNRSTNHVWIVDSFGRTEEISTTYKSRIARKIFDYVVQKH